MGIRLRTGNFKSNDLPELELIAGSNISLTGAESGKEIQVTISATGGGGGGGGGITLVPTGVKSGDYTAAPGDLVPVDTTSGFVTVTLPNAPSDGSVVAVKQTVRGGSNLVTVAAAGSDVFNKAGGATSQTLTLVNQGMLFQYQTSTGIWYVVTSDLSLATLDSRYVAAGAALDTLGATTDIATLNSSTSKHGLLRKLSGVVTQFLDGTGVFSVPVLDQLAAPSDVATLNATTSAHGLLRKLNGIATTYLDGTGAFSTPAALSVPIDTLGAPTDIATLNATTSAHGLLRKLNGNAATYLDGSGAFSTPPGGGTVTGVSAWSTTLAAGVSAGAGSITVSTVLPVEAMLLAQTAGSFYIAIDAYTANCEIRRVGYTGSSTSTVLQLGSVLANNHSSGAAVLVIQDVVYASWFGVKNGTLSSTTGQAAAAVAGLTQMQNLPNPVSDGAPHSGPVFYFGPGIWNFDDGIDVPNNTFGTIDGGGAQLSWNVDPGPSRHGISTSNSLLSRVENITLHGPAANHSGNEGVDPNCMNGLGMGDQTTVRNVNIYNFRYGMVEYFGDHTARENMDIEDCYFGVYLVNQQGGDNTWKKVNINACRLACVASSSIAMEGCTILDASMGQSPTVFYNCLLVSCTLRRISMEYVGNVAGYNTGFSDVEFSECYYSENNAYAYASLPANGTAIFCSDTGATVTADNIRGDLRDVLHGSGGSGATPLFGGAGIWTLKNLDFTVGSSIGIPLGIPLCSSRASGGGTGPNFGWDCNIRMEGHDADHNCEAFMAAIGSGAGNYGTDGHATNGSTAFTSASAAFSGNTSITIGGICYPIATVTDAHTLVLGITFNGTTTTTASWVSGPALPYRGDLMEMYTTGTAIVLKQTATSPTMGVMIENTLGNASNGYNLLAKSGVTRVNVDPSTSVAVARFLKSDTTHHGRVMQAADFTDGPIVGQSLTSHVDGIRGYASTRTVLMKLMF